MASTVNAAISALVGLLEADSALSGVTIHDGEPVKAETREWIAIGFQSGSVNSVEIRYDWAQLGAGRQKEEFDILCSLVTSRGDTDMSGRRARAVALRDEVAAVLAANTGLGLLNLTQPAHISSSTLLQQQGGQGSMAGFLFTVTVTARITA